MISKLWRTRGRVRFQVGHPGRAGGEMPEMLPFHDQDRKNTWRFRRYSDSFAMDF
jgi:hypothetical protein